MDALKNQQRNGDHRKIKAIKAVYLIGSLRFKTIGQLGLIGVSNHINKPIIHRRLHPTSPLVLKHIRGRLAESLIFLKDTYGYEDDNKTIKIYLSREDVANLSNMTTSNAIRTLSTFAQEGVIAIDGRKIRILDLPKLERISELG